MSTETAARPPQSDPAKRTAPRKRRKQAETNPSYSTTLEHIRLVSRAAQQAGGLTAFQIALTVQDQVGGPLVFNQVVNHLAEDLAKTRPSGPSPSAALPET